MGVGYASLSLNKKENTMPPNQPGYENTLLRGEQAPRPWDIQAEVMSLVESGMNVLDVCCGSMLNILRKLWRKQKI